MRSDFVACILTHGRADNVKTLKTLEKHGYTGDVILVVDDEDEQGSEYERRYGDMVHRFCKQDYIDSAQTMCPSSDIKRGVILYARNAAIDIAREAGYKWLIELDDDYTNFEHRDAKGRKTISTPVKDLDAVFEAMVNFVEKTGVATLAMAHGGDFVGGATGSHSIIGSGERWRRKAMNSFVLPTDTELRFRGSVNEDVVTYLEESNRGNVLLTCCHVNLTQTQTQSNKGGMTGEYKDDGTWSKSMFAVIAAPSCCTIGKMGNKNKRMHHRIDWNSAAPKIVRETV